MRTQFKLICFIAGFFTGAVFNWPLSYATIELWGIDHRYYMVIATLLLAFFLHFYIKENSPQVAVLLALGVVIAPALRILYDILQEPTSHTMWPIAIALYVLLVFPAAFLGTFLAQMLCRRKDN